MEPDANSNERKVIQASEILTKIERGEDVEYDGVIVVGELDLPPLHVDRTETEKLLGLPEERKAISSQIIITHSEILDAVNFSNVHFKKPINFKETKFGGDTNFQEAKFGEYVDFLGAEFGGYAHFLGAEFNGYVNFIRTKFGRYVDFGKAKFDGHANFLEAKFSEDVDFRETKFTGGNAGFLGVEVGRRADFWGAEFSGYAEFREAKFGGYADFRKAKFGGYAEFLLADFSGDAYFRGAEFGGHADFWGAKFGGYADFEGSKFDDELEFDNIKFERLYITWGSIKDKLAYNGPVYLALVKNFKFIERFGDADDCYYQYRKASQAQKKWYSEENRLIDLLIRSYSWTSDKIERISEYLSLINNYPPFTWIHQFNWSKLLDWIGFVSCGYGVRIQPIILWVLGSVLGFTLLYKLLPQNYGGIAESGPSTVTMEAVNNSTLLFTFSSGDGAVSPSWGECLYFSFTALTGGTPDGLHPVGLCKYAVMIEGVLGYLFLALFVVVLARKIIR